MLGRFIPPSALILSSSVTVSVADQSSWLKHPRRLLGISAFPTLCNRDLIELAPGVHTSAETVEAARKIFRRLNKNVAVIQDRVGMVLPRILCMIINEATFNIMEGTATPADIDTAMKLGTNYPLGPIEWADRIGIRQVVAVLDALRADLGEERYRVSPLLRQLAAGTKWW